MNKNFLFLTIFIFVLIIISIIILIIFVSTKAASSSSSNLQLLSLKHKRKELRVADCDNCDQGQCFQMIENIKLMIEKDYNIVRVSPNDPNIDILIYTVFGNRFRYIKAKIKIFYTGEPGHFEEEYKRGECDIYIGFNFETKENAHYLIRYPLYFNYPFDFLQKRNIEIAKDLLKQKTKFCCFLVSNNHQLKRNNFFFLLSEYKRVDSGGHFANNIGYMVSRDLEETRKFISEYKFCITFENSEEEGYTTEKLPLAWNAGTVPIYWGCPTAATHDFNPKCFINYFDFNDFQKLKEKVMEIDNNDELYLNMLAEPLFKNNEIPEKYRFDFVAKKLNFLIKQKL